jgi:two-component system phosphate regulon sensor histidine kinase PhoR
LQGTGLGLAIVQSVVSDHHGAISVTSDEGRGTTFRIDFPQRQTGQPVAAAREPASESKDVPPTTLAAASD